MYLGPLQLKTCGRAQHGARRPKRKPLIEHGERNRRRPAVDVVALAQRS